MSKVLSHRGYTGSVDVSLEDNCLHGRVQFIDDAVTYEGNSIDEIRASFAEAVDRYLEYCARKGRAAEKPCSGVFQVRMRPELHRQATLSALNAGVSLNEFVVAAVVSNVTAGHTAGTAVTEAFVGQLEQVAPVVIGPADATFWVGEYAHPN